jgi:prolyl-tRNA synthetase
MVRGDTDVNEIKVQNYLGCKQLHMAAPERIRQETGAEVGYAGPIGLPPSTRILADHYVGGRVNFECGANKTNYHNINVNFGRDLPQPEFGDFKLAAAGHLCPRSSSGKLQSARGIEIGHIFALGTKYSEAMKCCYLDAKGQSQPVHMGCYGIGVSRIAASAVEQNHDERGIIWPKNIAPYQVHLIGLNLEKEDMREACDALYERLKAAGFEVLYDDRELRAGEKFSDSDLIGIPVRVTYSKRLMAEAKLEVKQRSAEEAQLLSEGEAIEFLRTVLSQP